MQLALQLIHLLAVGLSLIRNGLTGGAAVKKPFLRILKGNGEIRLKDAKLYKSWTEIQWQQVFTSFPFQHKSDPKCNNSIPRLKNVV